MTASYPINIIGNHSFLTLSLASILNIISIHTCRLSMRTLHNINKFILYLKKCIWPSNLPLFISGFVYSGFFIFPYKYDDNLSNFILKWWLQNLLFHIELIENKLISLYWIFSAWIWGIPCLWSQWVCQLCFTSSNNTYKCVLECIPQYAIYFSSIYK